MYKIWFLRLIVSSHMDEIASAFVRQGCKVTSHKSIHISGARANRLICQTSFRTHGSQGTVTGDRRNAKELLQYSNYATVKK